MGPKLTSPASEARRQELLLLSTPLQAAQASPEGWEKLPEWLGWMNDSWGQPSPSGAERCSQGCGRGSRGTAAGRPAGKEEEEKRELNCVSLKSLKSASAKAGRRPRPQSAWRPAGLSRPHSFSALPGFRGGRPALSVSAPVGARSWLTLPEPGPRRAPKA